jgi:hypothetical protein
MPARKSRGEQQGRQYNEPHTDACHGEPMVIRTAVGISMP